MSRSRFRQAAAGLLVSALCLALPSGVVRAEGQAPVKGSTREAVPPKVSQEAALAEVLKYFAVPQGLKLQVELSAWAARPIWDIRVLTADMTQDSRIGGLSGVRLATVDGTTGRILSYDAYRPGPRPIPTGPQQATVQVDAARQKAEALVRALVPAAVGSRLRLDDYEQSLQPMGVRSGNISFTWYETQNDALIPQSQVMVVIDATSGQVIRYADELETDLHLPDLKAIVTADAALQRFREVPSWLVYAPVGKWLERTEAGAVQLQYWFPGMYTRIDAISGQWERPDFTTDMGPLSMSELLPAPQGTPVTPSALPMSKEDALRIAGGLFGLRDTAVLRVDSRENDILRVRLGSVEGPLQGYVSFDRATGQIRDLETYRPEDKQSMKDLEEEARAGRDADAKQVAKAKATAIHLVQTYFSQQAGQVRLALPDVGGWDPFEFTFLRFHEGIPVLTDQITIALDPETLAVRSIDSRWTKSELPSSNGIRTPIQAAEAFFAHTAVKLVYGFRRDVGKEKAPLKDRELVMGLFYELVGRPHAINAVTGEPVTMDGTSLPALERAQATIAGHWAEGELRFLLGRDLVTAEELNPAARVTYRKAAQLVVAASRRYYYGGVPNTKFPFADGKPESQPDAVVTRAEFAVWLARALQLGDLARSDLKVESPYKDTAALGAEAQKAVAFLRALGILRPAEVFRGADPLTQAEGAALTVRTYNYLLQREPEDYPEK